MIVLEWEIKDLDLFITKIRFRRTYLRNKDKPTRVLDEAILKKKLLLYKILESTHFVGTP